MKFLSFKNRVWSAAFFNVFAWAFQLEAVLRTKDVSGLSVPFILLATYIQITFAQQAWKDKTWNMFCGLTGGAAISSTLVILKYAL